ncbi:MAG: MMPL family transporter [Deltaproteobacteria bacterium]|nr:MMPL family transporter [Deltaproteobacteria bacterium]MBI3388978.1 MMPL family transporter [Deltaproteobacteria bacterium]
MARLTYCAWVAAIERHQRRIVIASVVACLLSAVSLVRLRLDIDVLGMLPRGAPEFDDFKSFVKDFGELNELIVLLDGADPVRQQRFADEFAGRLAALDTVANVQVRIDVDQVLDGMLGRYLFNYLPESDYDELAQRLTPEGIAAQVTADRAILSAPFDLSMARAVLDDPLGVRRLAGRALAASYGRAAPALGSGYFTSPDERALLLLVRPKASAFDAAFTARLMEQVHAAEAATRSVLPAAADLVRVRYTGSYAYALEDAATLKWDIARYTALALVGVLAVFAVGYRSLRILPLVAYPLIVTTLLTFALSLLLFNELNAVSISFAAILYGLSIDSGIYFFTRLAQERQRPENPTPRDAVTATLAGLGRANLAASTTTAVAFLVIGMSVLTAVSQLGILTALGMALTTAQFFTLYPALGFLWSGSARLRVADTVRLERWAQRAAMRPLPRATGALLLGIACVVAARHVELDVALTHLRPRDSEAVRVQDAVAAYFGEQSTGAAVLVRRADLDQALADGETVARQLRAYQAEGVLQTVQSVDALLPSARVQQARLDRYNQLPRAAALDTLRGALAAHGFVPARFTAFFDSFARDLGEIVRIDDPSLAPLRVLIDHHVHAAAGDYMVATYLQPAPGADLRAIADRLRRDLGAMAFALAARGLLEDALRAVLRRELAMFFALGIGGNLVLLLLTFGSLATALAILAPVVLVIVMLFAAMWASGMPLDPVNLIVTPLIFGIGVDYGVYIVARAREQAGVAPAIRSAGRAVVVTALTTVAGFGFLGLSRYPPLASLGMLAGAGLFLCLALSIVLLPALLTLAARASRAGV